MGSIDFVELREEHLFLFGEVAVKFLERLFHCFAYLVELRMMLAMGIFYLLDEA